jgi:hypothetical protein
MLKKRLSKDVIAEIIVAALVIVGAIGFIVLGFAAANGVRI